MTTVQRLKSDMNTMGKRDTADRTLSKSRDKNDSLTQERRFRADKIMGENRTRNDETTAIRRYAKDGNGRALAISLVILAAVVFGIYFLLG